MSSQAHERGGKAAASRQRILDCAAKLFRANGYAATALGDIAAASGMRTASLYYHFASKEDLVREVLRISAARTFDAARAAVAALPDEACFEDRLAAAIAAHLDELLGHADYTSADLRIVNQVPDDVRRDVLPIRRDYADWWRDLLQQGAQDGAIRADADLDLVGKRVVQARTRPGRADRTRVRGSGAARDAGRAPGACNDCRPGMRRDTAPG